MENDRAFCRALVKHNSEFRRQVNQLGFYERLDGGRVYAKRGVAEVDRFLAAERRDGFRYDDDDLRVVLADLMAERTEDFKVAAEFDLLEEDVAYLLEFVADAPNSSDRNFSLAFPKRVR